MFDNTLLNYPIELILTELGCKKGQSKDMWFSPFRSENTASLHINGKENIWFDHGAGIGGTNVQLVMLIKHCSYEEARKFIASLDPILKQSHQDTESKSRKSEIKSVRSISSYYIKKYIESRKIPVKLAEQYCKEIIVHSYDKNRDFTWIGFENNAGGYAMSSPSGYKSTDKAGITTINTEGDRTDIPSSENVMIFEGFFDFLSWQVLQSRIYPNCDAVVLNSAHLLHRAFAYIGLHKSIICFFDNDDTGKKYLQETKDYFKGKDIKDMSNLYSRYNDLNDMLKASKGYTAGVSIKSKKHIKK